MQEDEYIPISYRKKYFICETKVIVRHKYKHSVKKHCISGIKKIQWDSGKSFLKRFKR